MLLFLVVFALPLRTAARALASAKRPTEDIEFYVRGLVAGTIGLLAAYVFLSAELEKPLWLVLGLLATVPVLLREDEG